MENQKVTIKRIEKDDELYCKYETQSGRQKVYISLDLTEGSLTCRVNYEINATPASAWMGHEQWFGPIPALRADPANAVLEKFLPIAQDIMDNLDDWNNQRPYVEWKDYGEYEDFNNQAENFAEQVEHDYGYPEDVWEPYEFSYYYEPNSLKDVGEYGLTTKSTEKEIKEAAEHEIAVAEYPLEGDVDDLVEYLTEWIENEKDEENDAVEILGTVITNVITGVFEKNSGYNSSNPWSEPRFDKDDIDLAVKLAKKLVEWTNEEGEKDWDLDELSKAISDKGKEFFIPSKDFTGTHLIDDISYYVAREVMDNLNVDIDIN